MNTAKTDARKFRLRHYYGTHNVT